MSLIVVDVEADGAIVGIHSMVCFGAVLVDRNLDKTFYAETKPLGTLYDAKALSISGISREEHEKFPNPDAAMSDFAQWLSLVVHKGDRPTFISDNLAFDWQWINFYFHNFYGLNPFGFSGRRIGDIYAGAKGDLRAGGSEWKKFRKTRHSHNPVDDAMGNAEALIEIARRFDIKGIVN